MMQQSTKPHVILVHGLHMHTWAMQPLAKNLQKQGFTTHSFGYYSMWHDLSRHSERLNHWLIQRFTITTPLYFVGHSLGGLVIRDFLHRYPDWQVDRCVTLGTPHTGSLSANRVIKLIPSFIGRSYTNGLDGQVPALPQKVMLGSIAGNVSAGLGCLVLPRQSIHAQDWQNDGTVFVYETMPHHDHHHLCLNVSHTGMLFNPEVAQQVGYFLQHKKFNLV